MGMQQKGQAWILSLLFSLTLVAGCGYNTESNLFGVAPSAAAWLDPDWVARRQLTIDNSGQGDLSDFPVLVRLDASRIDYGLTQDTGADVRFVDTGGSLLSHEIERWDEAGESIVWVKVPEIPGGASHTITIYYGNPAAADAQQSADVWSNGYDLVYHFAGAAGDYTDSTGNGYYGTPLGGVTRPVTGPFGRSVEFDGTTGYVEQFRSFSGANAIPEMTVSVWFNTSFPDGGADNDNWSFIDFDRSDYFNFYLSGDQSELSFATTGGSTQDFSGTTTGLNDGAWHLGWAIYDGTDKTIYLGSAPDGTQANAHGGAGLGSTNTRWGMLGDGSESAAFGDGSGNNIYYDGLIDEIRFSLVARTSDWIAAQTLSMSDSMISYGSEETR